MKLLTIKVGLSVICLSIMAMTIESAAKHNSDNSNPSPPNTNCTQFDDNCDNCMNDNHCVFWFCRDEKQQWDGQSKCEGPGEKRPNVTCTGKWHRLEKPQTCAQINTTTTTTTTTTPTPIPITSSTTTSPITSTPIITTKATSPPTTASPQHDEQKLTGWTITGIAISSVLVVLILVGVSYKKVKKLYQARNPYRHFDS